jgi:hypothetical protein
MAIDQAPCRTSVPAIADGTARNNSPPGSVVPLDRQGRGAAVPRSKRIAATVAAQIAPQIDRALRGERPETLHLDFERKGFRDGVLVTVRVVPRPA